MGSGAALTEALAWRDATIRHYLREELNISGVTDRIRSFGATDEPRYLPPEQRMAVGIAFGAQPDDLGLALRIGKRGGKAERSAAAIAASARAAGKWVDIGYIKELAVAPHVETVAQTAPLGVAGQGNGRPLLRLGLSVSHPRAPAGSLGGFVVENAQVAILGACHVLANGGRGVSLDSETAPRVYQPSPADLPNGANARNEVGRLLNYVPLDDGATQVDAAIASVNDRWDVTGNVVPDVTGVPRDKVGQPIVAPSADDRPSGGCDVAKIGRKTGFTRGTVSAGFFNDVPIRVPAIGIVYYDRLFEIACTPERPFAEGGDSGALVFELDSLKGVGLVVGGGIVERDGQEMHCTYCCDLGRTLAQLGVAWY